jgi:hypothetical protein
MNEIQALKDLPLLVERKLKLTAAQVMLDLELQAAIRALGPAGWHYESLVRHLTGAEPQPTAEVREALGLKVANPVAEPPPVAEAPDPEPAPPEPAPMVREPVAPWEDPAPETAPPLQAAEREEDGRVSVHAYAKSLGAMPGPIGKLINGGTIKSPAINKARRIDPDLADRQLAKASFKKPSALQQRAKARLGLSQAEQEAVDAAIAQGKLVKDPGPARFDGGMRFGPNGGGLIETAL